MPSVNLHATAWTEGESPRESNVRRAAGAMLEKSRGLFQWKAPVLGGIFGLRLGEFPKDYGSVWQF